MAPRPPECQPAADAAAAAKESMVGCASVVEPGEPGEQTTSRGRAGEAARLQSAAASGTEKRKNLPMDEVLLASFSDHPTALGRSRKNNPGSPWRSRAGWLTNPGASQESCVRCAAAIASTAGWSPRC